MCSKNFCVQAKGGGHRRVDPPKYATEHGSICNSWYLFQLAYYLHLMTCLSLLSGIEIVSSHTIVQFFNCVRCIELNFAHCCVRAVCRLQVLQHQPQMTDVQYICLSPWSLQIVCCLQWLYFGRTCLHYALSLYFCVHWCCSPECVSFYTACRLLEQFSTICVVIFLHNVNFFSYILQLVRLALLALTDITVDQ